MNQLRDLIEAELKNIGLNYEYVKEKNMFLFNMTMDNSVGTLKVLIHVFSDSYVVYAILNNRVNSKQANRVSDFLHRANRGLLNGNFEYDHIYGEVRFKLFVNAKGTDISKAIIDDSISVPLSMFSIYGDGLLRVMIGKENPEKVINEIENPK